MSVDIKVPFKNHDHIKVIAETFLKKYHPKDSYPIPIEEIIEFKLGLDIIPLQGLHKVFEVDGFLSSDRTSISIDENVYQSRPGRYRFTLAHEVGHFILHKDLYDKHAFETIEEWKRFIEHFPEKEYSWFEWQAYEFSGLVLVPPHHLNKRLNYHMKQIESIGIRTEAVAIDRAIELLAGDFVVSREVIQRRLLKDKNLTTLTRLKNPHSNLVRYYLKSFFWFKSLRRLPASVTHLYTIVTTIAR